MDNAKLTLDGKEYELPTIVGSEGEVGLNIRALRGQSGAITMDPGFGNTGSCESAITFIDGEKGILRHRGYSIEDLAENSTFTEVTHLLIYGEADAAQPPPRGHEEVLRRLPAGRASDERSLHYCRLAVGLLLRVNE